MFILYTSPICPYCHKVESYLKDHGVPYEVRSVTDPIHREALIEQGGKMQVPYFVDTDANSGMYESADIITYIESHLPAPCPPQSTSVSA